MQTRHNDTASAILLCVFPWMFHVRRDADHASLVTSALLAGACAAACFWLLTRAARRYRTIQDIPTSTVRGAAMGLVELAGTSLGAPPLLVSPFSGRPCVYFEYTVESRRSSGRRERWEIVLSGSSRDTPFLLQDGTGTARVDPSRAAIEGLARVEAEYGRFRDDPMPPAVRAFIEGRGCPTRRAFGADRRLRIVDSVIAPDTPLYVVGEAREPAPGDAAVAVVVGPGPVNVISTSPERDVVRGYRLAALASLAGLALDVVVLGIELAALR